MRRFSRELPPRFSVDVEPDRDLISVVPRGELDVATAPELQRSIEELRDAGFASFRLDLRQLEFIDSCGLRLILHLAADDQLDLTVVPGRAGVRRVFEICGAVNAVPFLPAPRVPAALEVAV